MNTLAHVIPAIAAAVLMAAPAALGQTDQDDLAIGREPFRRIFLNAMNVEESGGAIQRVFHSLEKYSANPVLRRDKPWEGWGPYLYGTVLWDAGKLKMWYQIIGDGSRICYAESTDGIRWTKPELGIVEYNGSKANNIVVEGQCSIPSVIKVPNPESPEKAWVMYGYGPKGPHHAYSPDGLRWTWQTPPDGERLFSSSDVLNCFWDPYAERYVATFKLGARRHRSAGLATSKDGVNWTRLMDHPIMTADDLDPDQTQIYGMPAFPYQGCYIGQPWMYHARTFKYGKYAIPRMHEAQSDSARTMDVQLAWSWNMVNWTRPPERKPFLALGPDGSWDDGMVFTAIAPVVVRDQLYFYYGGFDQAHDDYRGIKAEIGLATLRLDGFCSMQAGADEGWLITRRELFRTPQVTINAKVADGGYVVAEIVDRHNKVIPGFSRQECIPFTGDSVRHVIEWETKTFPADVVKPDKKIRFYLKNAALYSYLPVGIDESEYPDKPD